MDSSRAIDWAALQRASLALSSGALCSSVLSAREQQSYKHGSLCCCDFVTLVMVWPEVRCKEAPRPRCGFADDDAL